MTSKKSSSNLSAIGLIAVGVMLTSFALVAARTQTVTTYASVLGDSTESSPEPTEKPETSETPEPSKSPEPSQTPEPSEAAHPPETNTRDTAALRQREIEASRAHLKYKIVDGKLELEGVDATGAARPATTAQRRLAEESLRRRDVKVATHGSSLEFEHNGVHVNTLLPLSVNTTTNQLTVTTPAGVKPVTTLPDTAIENLMSRGIISGVASGTASFTSVRLETQNGLPVYRVEGEKQVRIFGFIPATMSTTAFVSADTGAVVSQQETLLNILLKLISR